MSALDYFKKTALEEATRTIEQMNDGTFEKAAMLAKKATLRPINTHHADQRYAELEDELLTAINRMGYGPAGLGGSCTALGVNIETFPTHIAGMPVAVNICCHAARHKEIEI